MNYFLKSTDREALLASLDAAGLVINAGIEPGPIVDLMPTQGVSLDVIGTIYGQTGAVDGDGLPVMAAMAGYHANLIAELSPDQGVLLPLIAAPANPFRVWA